MRSSTFPRREGEWVYGTTRIVHASFLDHTDYEYYSVTACGKRGDRFEPIFHSLRGDCVITCLSCWAQVIQDPCARVTAE